MAFVYGPPVRGEDFVNRTKDIFKLISEIETRTYNVGDKPHIEVSAPRRIGKSSLLLKVQAELKYKEYTPIYIQLLDIATVDEFFMRLRNEILEHLPLTSTTREKLSGMFRSIGFNPAKMKGSVDDKGKITVDIQDVFNLCKGSWKECGTNVFKLLRKYKELKFVLFLDEMGFVRKLKDTNDVRLEFLNFLNVELSNPDTPVFVLCGSQNFFLILRNIKSEVFQLWRRNFMRMPIKGFDKEATKNKLLIPNFKRETIYENEFFTDEILDGLAEMIYFISKGYPSIIQILGGDLTFELKYYIFYGNPINMEVLEQKFMDIFKENILQDKQSICRELLSEEALGDDFEKYKSLIFKLYNNETLNIESIESELSKEELDEALRDLEEQQYIELNGSNYSLTYPFLKYFIWHPRKDAQSIKELAVQWKQIFHL